MKSNVDVLNRFRFCPLLYDLAHVSPVYTKTLFQKIIGEKHDNFEKNKKKYPGLEVVSPALNYLFLLMFRIEFSIKINVCYS